MLFYVPDRDHVFKLCAAGVLENRMDEASDAHGDIGGNLGERAGAYDSIGR